MISLHVMLNNGMRYFLYASIIVALASPHLCWSRDAVETEYVSAEAVIPQDDEEYTSSQSAATDFISAVKLGKIETACEMISQGVVDIDITFGPFNITFLHLAAKTGMIHIAQCLLDAGANINAHDIKGRTPYDYARRREDMQEFLRTWKPKPKTYPSSGNADFKDLNLKMTRAEAKTLVAIAMISLIKELYKYFFTEETQQEASSAE